MLPHQVLSFHYYVSVIAFFFFSKLMVIHPLQLPTLSFLCVIIARKRDIAKTYVIHIATNIENQILSQPWPIVMLCNTGHVSHRRGIFRYESVWRWRLSWGHLQDLKIDVPLNEPSTLLKLSFFLTSLQNEALQKSLCHFTKSSYCISYSSLLWWELRREEGALRTETSRP